MKIKALSPYSENLVSKIALEGVENPPDIERIYLREEMIQLEYPQSTFQILLIFLNFF